jgi:voltage-gated potassium channel
VGKRIKEELGMAEREVHKTGHYLVCGYSMVGKAIVRNLREKKADFVVIEQDKEKVWKMVEENLTVIEGDAREEMVLERAGIKNAGCLFVTMDDSYNVFVTLTAKMLNPSLPIVAKTENSRNIAKLKKAGADEVVACHDAGARMMIDKAKL